MLTNQQKSDILARIGIAVPGAPVLTLTIPDSSNHSSGVLQDAQQLEDADHAAAVRRWEQRIETLYVGYVAMRAARSLREAEEAQQMHRLRAANARGSTSPHSARANTR